MRQIGSHSLGDFPLPVVRIDYPRCERAGSYRLTDSSPRFGADAALPDVLMALVACERRKDFSRPMRRAVYGSGRVKPALSAGPTRPAIPQRSGL